MPAKKCLICQSKRLNVIEAAIMRGPAPGTIARNCACKAESIQRHIQLCMLPRLTDKATAPEGHETGPARQDVAQEPAGHPADWLSLPAVSADLKTALERLVAPIQNQHQRINQPLLWTRDGYSAP